MVALFRKKPAKDGSSGRRKLKDFDERYADQTEEETYEELRSEDGGQDDWPPEDGGDDYVDEGGGDFSLSGVKELSEILGRLEEIEDKIGRIDSALTTEKSEGSKDRERLGQMEQDIRKLLSVYEVVSAKFNPFIDVSEDGTPKPVAEEQAPNGIEFPDLELDGDLPEFRPLGEEGEEPPLQAGRVPDASRDTAPWEPGTPTETLLTMKKARTPQPSLLLNKESRDDQYEREVRAAARSKHNKKPLLAYIPYDYLTLVLVMRWIEFMFERVPRDKISLVLDYYVDVGWISEDVKSEIMSYARGEMQDITKYMGYEEAREEVFKDLPAPQAAPYKKVEDWRLSADDHLKSLLFIQKIAGLEIDKDRLNSLEQNISKFKESLEGFHGV